jgi:large subunit ribosomal protein L4
MKLRVAGLDGKSSTMTASDAIFGAPVNSQLLSQAIRVYLANLRQGTSKTKRRSEVNVTKSKWYRQKGTGNARHGSKNAPVFVGGGRAHGPRGESDWSLNLSPVMKKKAVISALSAQAAQIVVVDDLSSLKGKTQQAVKLLSAVSNDPGRVLVVIAEAQPLAIRSLRNLENVLISRVSRLTALEVSLADTIIVTSETIKALETRLTMVSKRAAK